MECILSPIAGRETTSSDVDNGEDKKGKCPDVGEEETFKSYHAMKR